MDDVKMAAWGNGIGRVSFHEIMEGSDVAHGFPDRAQLASHYD